MKRPCFFPSIVCKAVRYSLSIRRLIARQLSITEKWRDFAYRVYGLRLP